MRILNSMQELRAITGEKIKVPLPLEALRVKRNIYCPHCGHLLYDCSPEVSNKIMKCSHCGGDFYLIR